MLVSSPPINEQSHLTGPYVQQHSFHVDGDHDWIVFDARNDGDRSNDELLVRSDRLVLQSNDGDVIILASAVAMKFQV